MLLRMCYMRKTSHIYTPKRVERITEKRLPWEQTYSINSSWNIAVRQTQVYQKLPLSWSCLYICSLSTRHTFISIYATASSSHNCFIVLFLFVFTGLCDTLLVLVLKYRIDYKKSPPPPHPIIIISLTCCCRFNAASCCCCLLVSYKIQH